MREEKEELYGEKKMKRESCCRFYVCLTTKKGIPKTKQKDDRITMPHLVALGPGGAGKHDLEHGPLRIEHALVDRLLVRRELAAHRELRGENNVGWRREVQKDKSRPKQNSFGD